MSILPQYESLCNKKYTEQIKKINILKQILLFSSNLQLLYRITFDFSFNENYKIYNFKFRPKKGVPIGRKRAPLWGEKGRPYWATFLLSPSI